jgi:hypothetical protein
MLLLSGALSHMLCGAGKVYESQLSNYELVHVSPGCHALSAPSSNLAKMEDARFSYIILGEAS